MSRDTSWVWTCPDCGDASKVDHPGEGGAVECPTCEATYDVSRRATVAFGEMPA